MDYFAPFDAERCVGCGECFHHCPVLQLSLPAAKAEVARLARGEATRWVLQNCTSCLACNFICPENANPTQRILERWHDAAAKDGFPARAAYFDPLAETNFRTHVIERLPADERLLLDTWADTSPCEEVFYPGCNLITAPYLTRTRLLDGLEIRGTLAECCGEMYFRTGQTEKLARQAAHLTDYFARLRVKKVTVLCTACYNLLTNVLPRHGAKFAFTVEHLLPQLLARFESGELEVVCPQQMTVTIQESCHAKFFGDAFMDVPRRLLTAIGATVIEQARTRERALCCGIGGGFSHAAAYHPWNMTRETVRALREAERTGADALATYCAGCLQMLAVGRIAYPRRQPFFHLIELLQRAIGEDPPRPARRRALTSFGGVARHQGPALFSRSRTH